LIPFMIIVVTKKQTFLAFLEAVGVAVTLRLPARVLEDPALGPFDDALADSTLGVRTEVETVGIGVSPLRPGIGEMKLSKACNQTYKNKYLKKIDALSQHCLTGW
jgi:hypothetical protein